MSGYSIQMRLVGAWLLAAGTAAASDSAPRHVIYLHGRIIQEQQEARPRHPRYGYYELKKILAAFRERGFVVSGEIRPKPAPLSESADAVVAQVRRLLAAGARADHVTVVGASMGASIALLASTRLQNADLRFAVLGACLSANVRALRAEEGRSPLGHVLAVRETSDELTRDCPAWKDDAKPPVPLVTREVVVDTGLNHGFLYRPLPEWLDPVVVWAQGTE